MSLVTEAYRRLTASMEHDDPACLGLDMFTSDDADPEDRKAMAAICSTCPLLSACGEYARAARPPAGYWAGIGTKPRKSREDV